MSSKQYSAFVIQTQQAQISVCGSADWAKGIIKSVCKRYCGWGWERLLLDVVFV